MHCFLSTLPQIARRMDTDCPSITARHRVVAGYTEALKSLDATEEEPFSCVLNR